MQTLTLRYSPEAKTCVYLILGNWSVNKIDIDFPDLFKYKDRSVEPQILRLSYRLL